MTEEFNGLIRQLGEEVYCRVESELSGSNWSSVTLDVRFENRGAWLSRIRALKPDGRRVSIKMCNEIDLLLISINSERLRFEEVWYGLLFTVSANRHCEIDLNYAPDCSQDRTFFDA